MTTRELSRSLAAYAVLGLVIWQSIGRDVPLTVCFFAGFGATSCTPRVFDCVADMLARRRR
jgi:hypothetical protein